jgi:hypothetical protein
METAALGYNYKTAHSVYSCLPILRDADKVVQKHMQICGQGNLALVAMTLAQSKIFPIYAAS